MQFLVIGCTGMAGHVISLYLKEKGHGVTGISRRPQSLVDGVTGDLTEPGFVREIVASRHFDTIINCAGILNREAETDRGQAVWMNSWLPHFHAEITAGTDTKVIHLSTDCVFSGSRGQYAESDLPDGQSFYARSKALGEIRDEKNITIRTSFVGPDLDPAGIGLLNWFLLRNGETEGYTRAIWTGLTSLQLARVVERLACTDAAGIIHAVPGQTISKYGLLCLFNAQLRREPVEICPVDQMASDKSLLCTRTDVHLDIPGYSEMIRELAVWMREHRSLYPHYALRGD